ncbi:MAG: phenylalanine--tRNA ligase subunit beta, partial [Bacteroidales bacterium]|nr:phenylalanine--tRNA ligase subunit beta [Bacteroidales bacterium]
FIEGAYFDPVSVRKTAKSQTLSTDASFRFERGADPEAALYAAKRAALLILEVAGGKVVGKVREVYPQPIGRAQIKLDYKRIEHFIGKEIGVKTIEKILEGLNYQFLEKSADGALVAAPTYMVDVTRECDVVEEILRIYGYNNIELPQNLRMSVNPSQQPDPEATRNAISNWLAANGFVETMNNSLTKEDYYTNLETFPVEACVHIVNPLSSDLNVMRQTLLLNGLEVVAYNLNRQATSLKFFEYGSVYRRLAGKSGETLEGYEEHRCFSLFLSGTPEKVWRSTPAKSSFFQLKGYVEALMARYRIDVNSLQMGSAPADLFSEGITYSLPGKEPQLLATLGTLNPALCKRFSVKQPVFAAEINWEVLFTLIKRDKFSFKELPKFPEVRRDLAILLDEKVSYADVRKCAIRAGKKLIKSVTLFDVYRGEKILLGKKQYALNFVLQDLEHTLTDAEVESTMNRVLEALKNELGAILR